MSHVECIAYDLGYTRGHGPDNHFSATPFCTEAHRFCTTESRTPTSFSRHFLLLTLPTCLLDIIDRMIIPSSFSPCLCDFSSFHFIQVYTDNHKNLVPKTLTRFGSTSSMISKSMHWTGMVLPKDFNSSVVENTWSIASRLSTPEHVVYVDDMRLSDQVSYL